MRRQFLVGNFLTAYSDAYKYPEGFGRGIEKPDPEWLAHSFAHRAARHRERKQNYLLKMQLTTAFALLVVIGATTIDFRAGSSFEIAVAEQETVRLQEIMQTVQEVLPPPPPRPAVPVVVADDAVLEDDILYFDASLDLTEPAAALPPPPPVDEPVVEPEVFVVVEEQPEMLGGLGELSKALTYPPIAIKAGIEGMVVVKVVITEDGRPESPEILKSASSVLDEAAIDAVMKQRFRPGRQRGRPVACYMAIPVRFRLDGGAM